MRMLSNLASVYTSVVANIRLDKGEGGEAPVRLPLFTFKLGPSVDAFTYRPRRLHFLHNGVILCGNGSVKTFLVVKSCV